MHRKRLIGQKIRFVETGTQRIAMMGHQAELAGIQLNGCVFGLSIGFAVQPEGFCVLDFHLEIVYGRKFLQCRFGVRTFL